jgi:hypothetical protein
MTDDRLDASPVRCGWETAVAIGENPYRPFKLGSKVSG